MRSKLYPSEYLALITIKYDVDVDKFFNALVSAEKNRKSECGNLSIECRKKQNRKVIFLITQGSKVVAQFKIPEEFLSKKKNPIKEIRNVYLRDKYAAKKTSKSQTLHIKDLRVGMKKVNLKAKVLEISKPKFVVTRFGNHASVANATITDNTGKIKLCLWNDQINTITPGDTIHIKNARISAYKNERQMRVGKNGTLHTTQTQNLH
jgi:replication factor A1